MVQDFTKRYNALVHHITTGRIALSAATPEKLNYFII